MADIRDKKLKTKISNQKTDDNKPIDPMHPWNESFQKSPRRTVSYTCVPDKVIEQIEKHRKELKMNKKEFYIHALRTAGVDMPTYENIYPRQRKYKSK